MEFTASGETDDEFGQSCGSNLYEASRGIDESELTTRREPRSVSKETTFQRDLDNWQLMAENIVELIKDVIATIKEEGYRGEP